ncbi:hypothetical protein TNCV_3991341 [Trichonephila clavipes]|uniref:Uncharacterized protein n=1 Tax=Trichonephila clavipes TaxID=2585209 RepID=A0A8X6T166_TRICX|nr:hypothetical protein TNCV_3991341 [Trichonephila clavipes]
MALGGSLTQINLGVQGVTQGFITTYLAHQVIPHSPFLLKDNLKICFMHPFCPTARQSFLLGIIKPDSSIHWLGVTHSRWCSAVVKSGASSAVVLVTSLKFNIMKSIGNSFHVALLCDVKIPFTLIYS